MHKYYKCTVHSSVLKVPIGQAYPEPQLPQRRESLLNLLLWDDFL